MGKKKIYPAYKYPNRMWFSLVGFTALIISMFHGMATLDTIESISALVAAIWIQWAGVGLGNVYDVLNPRGKRK